MYAEDKENKGIIYRYISPSGKSYIGQTIRPGKRKHEHKKNAEEGEKGAFYNAIRKYGWDSFKYEVLFTTFEQDYNVRQKILNEREIYYIGLYDSFNNGYNETIGGNSLSGRDHPSYGTTLTEDHKRKLKQAVSKQVSQYTLEGDYVQTFESAADAARYLESDCASTILKVCKKEYGSSQGYQWRYGTSIDNIGKCNHKKSYKTVYQYNLDKELIKVWKSATEASEEEGFTAARICDCCNHKISFYGKKGENKFIWSYTVLDNLNGDKF